MCMFNVKPLAVPDREVYTGYKAFRRTPNMEPGTYTGLYYDENGKELKSPSQGGYYLNYCHNTKGAYVLHPPYLRAFHIFIALQGLKNYMADRDTSNVVYCKVKYSFVMATGDQTDATGTLSIPCVSALKMTILEEVA